jgi:hypothetical protein
VRKNTRCFVDPGQAGERTAALASEYTRTRLAAYLGEGVAVLFRNCCCENIVKWPRISLTRDCCEGKESYSRSEYYSRFTHKNQLGFGLFVVARQSIILPLMFFGWISDLRKYP